MSISDFVGLVIGVIVIVFLIWAWFGTGYRVESNNLKVQNGPPRQTFDIQEIKNITKEKSVWSSAALSMDRLVIWYSESNKCVNHPNRSMSFFNYYEAKIQIDDALSKLYKL